MSNTENKDKKTVYQKLLNIQTKLNAPKDKWNDFGNYPYRSAEGIMDALKPYLEEEKMTILISDEIVQNGERYHVVSTVTLIDIETGESIKVTSPAREEATKKGMDGSQITGASISYARKYALGGMFLIDDTKDSDATNETKKEKHTDKVQKTTNTNNSNKAYTVTEKQLKRLYAIAANRGIKADTVKEQVQKRFGKDPVKLTKAEYDRVCNGYENLKS